MNEEEIINKLKKEGYKDVYVWEDAPNFIYDKHCHEYETKLVIIKGNIEVEIEDEKINLISDKDFTIPAWKYHSAKVGNDGCRYVVGEDK